MSFWNTLAKPIIGLSPMDGITDPAFRATVDAIGKPSVLYTEFVSAEGLSRGASRLLSTFIHHESAKPLVGQLFGGTQEGMYAATLILCALGMDGIDINMGCPHTHITKSGGGASLIKSPALAQNLIKTAKSAVYDWQSGKTLDTLDLPKNFIHEIYAISSSKSTDRVIPVSVKTRIGYDKPITEEWISTILEMNPDAIVIHGRTLRQMYKGAANWDEIKKAADLAKHTNTVLIGNGDIVSFDMARQYACDYCPDGVLIGRAACGNPWIFGQHLPVWQDRQQAALLHIHFFRQLTSLNNPLSLRKHLAWYFKNIPQASEIRSHIMNISGVDMFETYIKNLTETI